MTDANDTTEDETPDDDAKSGDGDGQAQGVQPKQRGQRQRYEKAERTILTDWDLGPDVVGKPGRQRGRHRPGR